MHHEAHQLLVKVDLFLPRGTSHVESFWLLGLDLVKAVAEDWFSHYWVVRIQVYRVDFEMVVEGFYENVEVVGVCQECVRDYRYYFWKLVSLYEAWIESIQDKDKIFLCGVREIRPVESIRMIVLFHYCINMCRLWISIKGLSNINSVNIDILAQQYKSPHKPFLALSVSINNRVKNFKNAWFNTSRNRRIKVSVIRAQDINVSVIVFRSDQVKLIIVVDAVPQELVFDGSEILLASALQKVVLFTVREDGGHEVVRQLDHYVSHVLHVGDGSNIVRLVDVEEMDGGHSVELARDLAGVWVLTDVVSTINAVVEFYVRVYHHVKDS